MKKRIIIEEIRCQKFEVEVENMEDDVYEIVQRKYKNKEFVLDNPRVTQVNMLDDFDGSGDWVDLHCSNVL